jgi:hypothetical protein
MEHYVGLDVSLKLTAICIVDQCPESSRELQAFTDCTFSLINTDHGVERFCGQVKKCERPFKS